MNLESNLVDSNSGYEEGEIIDDFEFIISSDDELSAITRLHNQFGDSNVDENVNEGKLENTMLPTPIHCKNDAIENSHLPPDSNNFSKRKRKKRRRENCERLKRMYLANTTKKENILNRKNRKKCCLCMNSGYSNSIEKPCSNEENVRNHFEEETRYCDRKRLKVALLRNNWEEKKTLKERLQIYNRDMPNNHDGFFSSSKNDDCNSSIISDNMHQNMEDDSCEEKELRLIALKSAYIKKHFDRKKRFEQIPYSPTDLEKSYAECDDIELDDVPFEEESTSRNSPQNLTEINVETREKDDTMPKFSADNEIIDMEISSSESESDKPINSNENVYPKLTNKSSNIYLSPEFYALYCSTKLNLELMPQNYFQVTSIPSTQSLPPLDQHSKPILPVNAQTDVVVREEREEEEALRALLLSKYKNIVKPKECSFLVPKRNESAKTNIRNNSTNPTECILKKALLRLKSVHSHSPNQFDTADNSNVVETVSVQQSLQPDESANKEKTNENFVQFSSVDKMHMNNVSTINTKPGHNSFPKANDLVVVEEAIKKVPNEILPTNTELVQEQQKAKKQINSHFKKESHTIQRNFNNLKKINTARTQKIIKSNKVINKKLPPPSTDTSKSNSKTMSTDNRLIKSVDLAAVQVKQLIIQLNHSESEDNSDNEVKCISSNSQLLLKRANACTLISEKPSKEVTKSADNSNNESLTKSVNKTFEKNIDDLLNKIRSDEVNKSHTQKTQSQSSTTDNNSMQNVSCDATVQTHCDKSSEKTVLKGNGKSTQQIDRKKQAQKLKNYEEYLCKMSSNIFAKVNNSIQLVEDAKKIKTSKVLYEAYLQNLQIELNLIRKRLKGEQEKMKHIFPEICKSTELLSKLREKFGHLKSTTLAIGKSSIGDNYSLPNIRNEEIAQKFKVLASEIKQVNAIKYNSKDVLSFQQNNHARCLKTSNKNLPPSQVDEKIMECINKRYNCHINKSDDSKIESSGKAHKLNDERHINEDLQQQTNSINPNSQDSKLIKNMNSRDIIQTEKELQINKELPDYISPLPGSTCVKKRQTINPHGVICPYELLGRCVDKDCKFNHLHAS